MGPVEAGRNDVVDGDDRFVDELLNLNADVDLLVDQEDMQINEDAAAASLSPSPFQPPPPADGEDGLGSVLNIPEEEPHLEWLSHFVEESFSQFYPAGAGVPPPPENPTPESETHNASLSSFSPPAAVPKSRRSKRPRCALPFSGHIWLAAPPAGSPPLSSLLTESTTTSSSCSSATSSPWPPTSPSTPLSFQTRDPNPKKKQRKVKPGSGSGSGQVTRKCSHCGTQKTPQWRAGPMGAKTLCNACGVRFKSGRLLPEYRPACSPTFSSELHSNSHRKVLEMRKRKEVTGQPEPGFGSGFSQLFGYRTS